MYMNMKENPAVTLVQIKQFLTVTFFAVPNIGLMIFYTCILHCSSTRACYFFDNPSYDRK